MENYKEVTRLSYNTYPKQFDEYFERSFREYMLPRAQRFIELLKGKRILDLGSGPGNHAVYFRERGLNVLCVDISEKFIQICKEKGLCAEVMDMENMDLPLKSLDGVWANAALLHLPKSHVPEVLRRIANILVPNGLLFISVRKGSDETFDVNPKYPGTKRFFSNYSDEEMLDLLSPLFEILESAPLNVKNKYIFLNYFCRKKNVD